MRVCVIKHHQELWIHFEMKNVHATIKNAIKKETSIHQFITQIMSVNSILIKHKFQCKSLSSSFSTNFQLTELISHACTSSMSPYDWMVHFAFSLSTLFTNHHIYLITINQKSALNVHWWLGISRDVMNSNMHGYFHPEHFQRFDWNATKTA